MRQLAPRPPRTARAAATRSSPDTRPKRRPRRQDARHGRAAHGTRPAHQPRPGWGSGSEGAGSGGRRGVNVARTPASQEGPGRRGAARPPQARPHYGARPLPPTPPGPEGQGGPALTGGSAAEPNARCHLGRVLPPAASQSRGARTQLRRRPVTRSPDTASPPGSLTTRTSGVPGSPGLAPRSGRRKSRLEARQSRPRQPHFRADRGSARLELVSPEVPTRRTPPEVSRRLVYRPRRRKSHAGPALRRISGVGLRPCRNSLFLRSSLEVPPRRPRWLGLGQRGILKPLAAHMET